MNIIKKFQDKEAVNRFKKDFKTGLISSTPIENFISGYLRLSINSEELKKFDNFKDFASTLIFYLDGNVLPKILEINFGAPDFQIKANRVYKNYIVDYNGMTFLLSSKPEIILKQDEDLDIALNCLSLYKEIMNECLSYSLSHIEEQPNVIKEVIDELKKNNIIIQDKFNFELEGINMINKIRKKFGI